MPDPDPDITHQFMRYFEDVRISLENACLIPDEFSYETAAYLETQYARVNDLTYCGAAMDICYAANILCHGLNASGQSGVLGHP